MARTGKGASNWGPDEHKPPIDIDKVPETSPLDCSGCGGTGQQARARHDNTRSGQGTEYQPCPHCKGTGISP